MNIKDLIPAAWKTAICSRVTDEHISHLNDTLNHELNTYKVFPSVDNIFRAIEYVTPRDVKVVILGQDPYHEPGQAHGLSFSVPTGQALPPSLRNIYKELHNDLNIAETADGNLGGWARQGVLLLNTVLTVRAHQANSHKHIGWDKITSAILQEVMKQDRDVVFLLWGSQADNVFKEALAGCHFQKYPSHIHVIRSAHPSPLSAYRGFFGSKPFSTCNELLEEAGIKPINWGQRA